MRVLFLLAVLAAVQSGAAERRGTPLPPGSSTIAGVVTDALSKKPIKGCRVYLSQLVQARPASGGAATSGPDGRYSFTNIVDGEYAVNASCEGYLASCHRAEGGGPPRCYNVAVVVDQNASSIDFSLTPEARARGRVVDSSGRPVANATVRLGMPLRDQLIVMNRPAQTDRDGRFELSALPDGEWRLEVDLPETNDTPRPPVIYFPGVLLQADAGSIELVAGRTLDDILIVTPPLEANRLTVRIVTLEQTMSKVDLALVRMDPLTSRRIMVDETGTGIVNGMLPGRYFLSARGYSADRMSVAHDVVEFSGGSQEVLLYMQAPARIVGRIIGEQGITPSLEGVRVGAAWIQDGIEVNPLSVDEADLTPEGTFHFAGLFGTRQLRLFGLDPAFAVQSILEGRTDVTAGITLTPDAEVTVVIVVGQR